MINSFIFISVDSLPSRMFSGSIAQWSKAAMPLKHKDHEHCQVKNVIIILSKEKEIMH